MSNENDNPGALPEDFVDEGGSQGETDPPVVETVPEVLESTPTPESGVQTEFQHALLQGKSSAEIDSLVATLEAATKEQGRELSRLHAEQSAPVIDTTPAEVPSQEEYFANPGQVIRNEVQSALREAIDPFKRDLAKSNERDVWATVAAGKADFDIARPLIEVYLQKNPGIPVTVESVTTLYYTAKGYMAENGGAMGAAVVPTTPASPPAAPPQHAASSHPIPQAAKKAAARQLTENERRLARENGYTDEQYLAWLDLTEDEILTAEIK
jgi:hypothetical protein